MNQPTIAQPWPPNDFGGRIEAMSDLVIDGMPAAGYAAALPAPVATAGGGAGRATILLVDDEDSVRAVVGMVLRGQGYDVLDTATPRACEMFARHPAIDLLLTDIGMRNMNGPALAQQLVGLRPELRVLFMSEYSTVAMPAGGNHPHLGFLSKPFRASVLTERVQHMLSRPAAIVPRSYARA